MKALRGVVFYASKKAQQDRYIKEGLITTISSYKNYHVIPSSNSDKFIEINLDSSGTSYVHMQLV